MVLIAKTIYLKTIFLSIKNKEEKKKYLNFLDFITYWVDYCVHFEKRSSNGKK